jgi:hypothetical protein
MAIRDFVGVAPTAEAFRIKGRGAAPYGPDPCGAALLIEIILRIRYTKLARSRDRRQVRPVRGAPTSQE